MSTSTITPGTRGRVADEGDLDMDPRIADRRSEVQREHRRRRRTVLLALCVVTVVALTVIGLTRSAALDVDHIDVVGADRTNVDGLIGASGLSFGAPMTELDLNGARDAIAGMPWIADVRIKRQWPNRVSIAVLERTPVAAVFTVDERWALVDESGQVLTVSDGVSERWARIEGVEPADGPGGHLGPDADGALTVAAALPVELRDGVDQIMVDDLGQVSLRFRTGQTARLGGVGDLDAKFPALLSVFGQVDDCGIDVIDLSAVDLITVTRVPDCRFQDPQLQDPQLDAAQAAAGDPTPATSQPTGPTAQGAGDG